MAFSGSLFALGYFLGTRDGLQSVKSPSMIVGAQEEPSRTEPRERAKPTRAALGEVEFLFPEQTVRAHKKTKKAERVKAVKKTPTAIVKSRTARRGIPRLKPKRSKPVAEDALALPTLPELPNRLRQVTSKANDPESKKSMDAQIPRLTVSKKQVLPEVGTLSPRGKSDTVDTAVKPEQVKVTAVNVAVKRLETRSSTVRKSAVKADAVKQAETKPKNKIVKTVSRALKSKPEPVKTKPTLATLKPRSTSKPKPSKSAVKLANLKPVPAHNLSTHGAHYFTVHEGCHRPWCRRIGFKCVASQRLRAQCCLGRYPSEGSLLSNSCCARSLEAARKFQKLLSARGASSGVALLHATEGEGLLLILTGHLPTYQGQPCRHHPCPRLS